MRYTFAFAWLALAVGWCCHAVSDSDHPEGAPDPAVAPDPVDAPCAANADAFDEQPQDEQPPDEQDEQPPHEQLFSSDDDSEEDLVVVRARDLRDAQEQWEALVNMKRKQLELMTEIKEYVDRLGNSISNVLGVDEAFDNRIPKRPRVVGRECCEMVAWNGIARIVQGNLGCAGDGRMASTDAGDSSGVPAGDTRRIGTGGSGRSRRNRWVRPERPPWMSIRQWRVLLQWWESGEDNEIPQDNGHN